jgi:hypothetical protein
LIDGGKRKTGKNATDGLVALRGKNNDDFDIPLYTRSGGFRGVNRRRRFCQRWSGERGDLLQGVRRAERLRRARADCA